MKFFNSQNTRTLTPGGSLVTSKVFLLYFTSEDGSFDVYHFNPDTKAYSSAEIKDLIKAEEIYISYSYLGGIHLSNYSATIQTLGTEFIATFSLKTVTAMGIKYYDIPNAVFLNREGYGDDPNSQARGLEPVKTIRFTILTTSPDDFYDIEFTTFEPSSVVSLDPFMNGSDLEYVLHKKAFDGTVQASDYEVMDYLVNDSKITGNLSSQSFRALVYTGTEVEEKMSLVAAFFGYAKVENTWYQRLYLVNSSTHIFQIDQEPDILARACLLEKENRSVANMDYGDWFEDIAFKYYQMQEE